MNLHMEVDLERKFTEMAVAEKREMEKYESQEKINEMVQQPIDKWLSIKPFEEKIKTRREDEFFF